MMRVGLASGFSPVDKLDVFYWYHTEQGLNAIYTHI